MSMKNYCSVVYKSKDTTIKWSDTAKMRQKTIGVNNNVEKKL